MNQIPLNPPFTKGEIMGYPSLAKRGKGRFEKWVFGAMPSKTEEMEKEMDWKSHEMETRVKGKNTRLNSASLWRAARTLMARERARALGSRFGRLTMRIDPGVSIHEREADFWKRQRE